MYRVEDKYMCTEKDLLLLQSRVKGIMKPDLYSNNASYRVTSLYFDDYKDRHLSDAEEGISHRTKYRIRIYNDSLESIKLEVKYKAYNRVLKKSEIISRDTAKKLMAGQCVDDDNMSMNSPITLFNLSIKQDCLKPKVIVKYDRCAYTFSPGNVRITFDRNIRFSSNVCGFLENNSEYTMLKDVNRVLEIKYDEFIPGFIAQLLESGNMNQISYSKYKLCRNQLEG